MANFTDEREGQIDFYSRFLPRIDNSLNMEDIISDSNDGVINGNLLEFKKEIKNLNSALFQGIKYESARRIKGKPVTANIILIDVNAEKAWLYKAERYLEYIEQVYTGGASKGNESFVGGKADMTFQYTNPIETEKLISVLKEKEYVKIHIDENCIVGWAVSYYFQNPNARKEDFLGDDTGKHKTIGEIRSPKFFKDYIYPYTGETNVKFNYLMDKLNDTLQKKNLGAFYTHRLYAEKSLELVRKAIARVPKGNDYVIIDRCAGTGNLELGLTDEELSHCIVSTMEYYEYKVLLELIGNKVRHIIPPIESKDTFNAGLVTGADALSKEFIENELIKKYINESSCTIILFENPPFIEPQAVEGQKTAPWKRSFATQEMKKKIKGTSSNELGNVFIWSAFNYYLRQPTDSYIVYSPVKYWKAQHLVNKKFLGGFAFNRRHFHTNIDACVMCALWSNEEDVSDEITLSAYEIDDNNKYVDDGKLSVKKIYTLYSQKYNDKRVFDTDTDTGIVLGLDGKETTNHSRIKPIYNDNILGYMIAGSSGFDKPDLESSLLTCGCYRGNGFFLRKDNYLEKLPMFCATRYIRYNRKWTERGRIMKSADGEKRFILDIQNKKLEQFLLKCLLFTCIEQQNHMRTFMGSDGRFYRNELCLDTTNGETLASMELSRLQVNKLEKRIMEQYKLILEYAKQSETYQSAFTYGIYQITTELDTFHKNNVTGITEYDNQDLHSHLIGMKPLVKEYYNTEIVPVLFDYEFLK